MLSQSYRIVCMRLLFNDEKMDVSSKNGKIVGDSEDMQVECGANLTTHFSD